MNNEVRVCDLVAKYDKEFVPSREYLDSMPDLQNSEYSNVPIDFVGIHDFKVPLKIATKNGGYQEVCASITGLVSLEAEKRGINMSRIIRTFYKSKDDVFNISHLKEVLEAYRKDLDSFDAHILINFPYYVWQDALRSRKDNGEKEGGYQYYNVTFDCNLDVTGEFKSILSFDYIYSSACPCSSELTKHNAYMRGKYGIPHSQRSVARIYIDFDEMVWIEDLLDACNKSLTTETLVFCKRQDEQAFSEANGAQVKFVEDAIRFLKSELDKDERIKDFKIICSHQESLHNHNAIAVTTKGLEHSIFNHRATLGELENLRV